MKFVNLTPHGVNYIHEDGSVETFPSQGCARAAVKTEVVGSVDGYRMTKSVFGAPVDLPEYQEGVLLIVSLATANSAKQHGRRTDDLVITNEAVRDDSGAIIGCRSFGVVE